MGIVGGVSFVTMAVICVIGLILYALYEELAARWHRRRVR